MPRRTSAVGWRSKLDAIVGRAFPLREAAAALELIGTGHAGGKVVLTT